MPHLCYWRVLQHLIHTLQTTIQHSKIKETHISITSYSWPCVSSERETVHLLLLFSFPFFFINNGWLCTKNVLTISPCFCSITEVCTPIPNTLNMTECLFKSKTRYKSKVPHTSNHQHDIYLHPKEISDSFFFFLNSELICILK